MRFSRWLATTCVLWFAPWPSVAQPYPLDPFEFQVNVFTPTVQKPFGVVRAPDGGFVVAWSSWESPGGGWAINLRAFDCGGQPRGGDFQVNTVTSSVSDNGSIAGDRDGNFVVVWESFGS